MYIYHFYSFNLTYIKYKYAKYAVDQICFLSMQVLELCYLEPSIVFKAKVARHVRIQYQRHVQLCNKRQRKPKVQTRLATQKHSQHVNVDDCTHALRKASDLIMYGHKGQFYPGHGPCVGLNSVHCEILSSVIIVVYDKVRGRNKAQR